MDQDLLGACKIWLEPLDNKSLPALNIQNALFKHFLKVGSTIWSLSFVDILLDEHRYRNSS